MRLGRGYLELRIEDAVDDPGRTILVMCAGGTRSLFAAESLRQMGYEDVRSVGGGFNRWKNNGLPYEVPRQLDAGARERYSRHLLLPEVGEAGQLKLMDSKVLLIGAGGLGSPAAFYLAAAGRGDPGDRRSRRGGSQQPAAPDPAHRGPAWPPPRWRQPARPWRR